MIYDTENFFTCIFIVCITTSGRCSDLFLYFSNWVDFISLNLEEENDGSHSCECCKSRQKLKTGNNCHLHLKSRCVALLIEPQANSFGIKIFFFFFPPFSCLLTAFQSPLSAKLNRKLAETRRRWLLCC